MNTTVEQLARQMTARNVTAALVSSESSAIIGIVTDHDLRARVLAERIKLSEPIHSVMSAPLTKISGNALIYEALMQMEEKGVRHLAVEDQNQNGQIVSVIDNKSLIQFQRYGAISRAETPADADEYFLRLGALVRDGLDRAGYPFCRGQVMASNPRWCRSLPDWISSFDEWVHKSEPQEIIDISVFFDFRTAYGDAELTHELRRTIYAALQNAPAFFHQFAQNALMFKPPFRLLGNIYLTRTSRKRFKHEGHKGHEGRP
jgi:signal-transduction protein with cAMP-binding, CBS, and nucleotidyltransferase domain